MTPEEALLHYTISEVREIKPITIGLIHATYRVETKDGTYILQQLHPMLAHPSLTADYEAVTDQLSANGQACQQVVRTSGGELTIPDEESDERSWRLLVFVPGRVYETLSGAKRARECGAAVGKFHGALTNFPYHFASALKFHPYDVEKFYKDFLRVTKKFNRTTPALMASVKKEVVFLTAALPKLFLPKNLPARTVHGDLKITNFVFDERGARVRSIIDLDTCAKFPIALEFGDALRSWCGRAEDDPKNKFNTAMYRAAIAGYTEAAGKNISERELKYIPAGVKLLTLNLASRFLKDYFENNYFGYNTKKYNTRRAANLARTRGQLALFRDLEKKI